MQRLDGIVGALPQYLLMLRSQYWSEDKLGRYVDKHLGATLAAARSIPFYRERFGPEVLRSPELTKLPILPRHEIPQLAASVRALHSDASLLASGLTSGSTGNPVFNVPASMLGIPAVSLPLLSIEGLPLGLQIAGFVGEDASLFAVAAAIRDLLGAAA